jgi:hypothetical protein
MAGSAHASGRQSSPSKKTKLNAFNAATLWSEPNWTGPGLIFAAKLRADPAEMRNLRPTTAAGADSKLFSLWQLLNQTAHADRRYALDSIAPLEPMIGPEAAEGFRLGLIAHWRAWTPSVRSVRNDGELNQIRQLDCMGLVGISLEAKAQRIGPPH